MSEKINIAFGVTEDWLEYTYVTMCSILSNAGNHSYKFFVLSDLSVDSFTKKFEPIYKKLFKIHPFEYKYLKMNNSDFNGVVHDTRVGISAYYRLKLPTVTDVDKIIYLDSDIVVSGDISDLWSYDIENYLIGAVEDKYSSLMTYKANLSDNDIYINSGVMIMNLKEFRSQNLEQKIFAKLKEENNNYSDQDVLNDLCRNQILYLPLKYNLMPSTDDLNAYPNKKEEYDECIKNPFILHYAIKPWIIPVQYSEYWFKYKKVLSSEI